MAKVILGYVVMTVLQFALAAIGGLILGFLVQAITKNAQGYAIEAVFWVFSTITGFIAYWVSLRFVVQPRTAATASLNNPTNSECKS